MTQIEAMSNSILRGMPPGIFPPSILKYDASSVPILQLGLESQTLSEQQLFDIGQNFIRTPLAMVQGAAVPSPYGGKWREIVVDLDPAAMYANQLSATDVSNALNLQNLILPAGSVKIGQREYQVQVNSSPVVLSEMNKLPIRTVNGATVYLKDVANVRDGYAVQTNIVRTNGTRGALLTVMRNGTGLHPGHRESGEGALPKIMAGLPDGVKVRELFDQSIFVRASISGVLKEATTAALLTGLMILLFLGSWRSTVIVCISIPLSILTSIIILDLLGQTINVMTLGGMALAVGILVDDATVEIENTHRNLAMKKPLVRAVLDGANADRGPGVWSPRFPSASCSCPFATYWSREVSVHTSCHGSGFRHARVVHAFSNVDSNHGALPAETGGGYVSKRRARRGRNRRGSSIHLARALCL